MRVGVGVGVGVRYYEGVDGTTERKYSIQEADKNDNNSKVCDTQQSKPADNEKIQKIEDHCYDK